MQQVHPEKLLIRKTKGYWIRTLYVAVVVIVGMGGFMLGGVDASSGFLANIQEVWGDIFGDPPGGVVEVFEVDEFVPGELDGGADRIITAISEPKSRARVSNVSATESLACSFNSEDAPSGGGVLISEVAWMGGLDNQGLTHADEWIELANASEQVIDIGGWSLIDQKGDIEIIFPEGTTLMPESFLLLERSNNDSVPGVAADFIYVGALSNQDEGLRLFDSNCTLIDEVLADPTWPAGDATGRRTMERSPNLGWHTFSGELINGMYGTPGAINSEPAKEEDEEEDEEKVGEEPQQNIAICEVGNQAPSYKVLINEVAWAGQSGNPSGEWIELKNNTNSEVSLANWQLIDAEQSIKIFFQEGEEVDEYLLLGRIPTTANSNDLVKIATQTVDKTYTGVLQNSNEALYLFDENCELVDKVDEVGSNWSNIGGSASPEYKSTERTNVTNWHTYSGAGTQAVMGTPRAANSQPQSKEPIEGSGGGGAQIEIEEDPEPKPEEVIVCEWEEAGEASREVLINEVAWMGGLTLEGPSPSDEWIELKNISGEELDISYWQVLDVGGDIHITFPEGTTLMPGSFLLLERSNDDSVPVVAADFIYVGALSNQDEGLRLLDKDCMLVDEVLADPAWPKGDNTSKRTMERTDDLNWQTFLGEEAIDGIWGTPRADNSEEEVVDEEPVEDEEDSNDEQNEEEGDTGNGGGDEGSEEELEEEFEGEAGDDTSNEADVEGDTDGGDECSEEDKPEVGPEGFININTAGCGELQWIKWVGSARAQNIIDYREGESGPFETIEEIQEISGIGEGRFNDMKGQITV